MTGSIRAVVPVIRDSRFGAEACGTAARGDVAAGLAQAIDMPGRVGKTALMPPAFGQTPMPLRSRNGQILPSEIFAMRSGIRLTALRCLAREGYGSQIR
ncbi:hypothetical protein BV379_19575 [Rhodovulum sulfidophilum]|nr:hypothetical protein BV379_19575 [Rhodovulum sulfidophilum]